MSDSATIVVRVDPADPDAVARARTWLREAGFEQTGSGRSRALVVTERAVYDATENDAAPTCRSCGRPADQYDGFAWVDPWLADGIEPVFACAGCGWSAPYGDWPGECALAIGAPAVQLVNCPPLAPEGLLALRAALGGRTRVVRAHY